MTIQTWNTVLREQIDWHWNNHVRPRLAGLTDDEYFWEPAPDCWNVRDRGTGTAPIQGGSGAMTIDFAWPEPDPAPVTTIAWRLGHVIVGVLAMRNVSHFGRPETDYYSFEYAETAAAALTQLDNEYAVWNDGVAALGEEGLLRPSGPTEGQYADYPIATLILHVNRELIHHLSEISLLRDLYAHTRAQKATR